MVIVNVEGNTDWAENVDNSAKTLFEANEEFVNDNDDDLILRVTTISIPSQIRAAQANVGVLEAAKYGEAEADVIVGNQEDIYFDDDEEDKYQEDEVLDYGR